jgi:hypothetical protein
MLNQPVPKRFPWRGIQAKLSEFWQAICGSKEDLHNGKNEHFS